MDNQGTLISLSEVRTSDKNLTKATNSMLTEHIKQVVPNFYIEKLEAQQNGRH